MPVKVILIDNSDKVLAQLEGNKEAALNAIGTKAVNLIMWQMQQGYGKPIRQTGDLQRDVQFEIERSGPDTVDVGNTLKYAPFVHDGTSRMKGRPYIADGLNGEDHKKQLQKVAGDAIKIGFE
jgi:hypothetical protein